MVLRFINPKFLGLVFGCCEASPLMPSAAYRGPSSLGFLMNGSDNSNRLNAECQYMAAPIYAGSPESQGIILAQDVFREAFERIATNDIAGLSVGDLTMRSLLSGCGQPWDVTTDELVSLGAVGDILGQFYN